MGLLRLKRIARGTALYFFAQQARWGFRVADSSRPFPVRLIVTPVCAPTKSQTFRNSASSAVSVNACDGEEMKKGPEGPFRLTAYTCALRSNWRNRVARKRILEGFLADGMSKLIAAIVWPGFGKTYSLDNRHYLLPEYSVPKQSVPLRKIRFA